MSVSRALAVVVWVSGLASDMQVYRADHVISTATLSHYDNTIRTRTRLDSSWSAMLLRCRDCIMGTDQGGVYLGVLMPDKISGLPRCWILKLAFDQNIVSRVLKHDLVVGIARDCRDGGLHG